VFDLAHFVGLHGNRFTITPNRRSAGRRTLRISICPSGRSRLYYGFSILRLCFVRFFCQAVE
jgi:hypothetical protein